MYLPVEFVEENLAVPAVYPYRFVPVVVQAPVRLKIELEPDAKIF